MRLPRDRGPGRVPHPAEVGLPRRLDAFAPPAGPGCCSRSCPTATPVATLFLVRCGPGRGAVRRHDLGRRRVAARTTCSSGRRSAAPASRAPRVRPVGARPRGASPTSRPASAGGRSTTSGRGTSCSTRSGRARSPSPRPRACGSSGCATASGAAARHGTRATGRRRGASVTDVRRARRAAEPRRTGTPRTVDAPGRPRPPVTAPGRRTARRPAGSRASTRSATTRALVARAAVAARSAAPRTCPAARWSPAPRGRRTAARSAGARRARGPPVRRRDRRARRRPRGRGRRPRTGARSTRSGSTPSPRSSRRATGWRSRCPPARTRPRSWTASRRRPGSGSGAPSATASSSCAGTRAPDGARGDRPGDRGRRRCPRRVLRPAPRDRRPARVRVRGPEEFVRWWAGRSRPATSSTSRPARAPRTATCSAGSSCTATGGGCRRAQRRPRRAAARPPGRACTSSAGGRSSSPSARAGPRWTSAAWTSPARAAIPTRASRRSACTSTSGRSGRNGSRWRARRSASRGRGATRWPRRRRRCRGGRRGGDSAGMRTARSMTGDRRTIAELVAAAEPAEPRPLGGLLARLDAAGLVRGARRDDLPIGVGGARRTSPSGAWPRTRATSRGDAVRRGRRASTSTATSTSGARPRRVPRRRIVERAVPGSPLPQLVVGVARPALAARGRLVVRRPVTPRSASSGSPAPTARRRPRSSPSPRSRRPGISTGLVGTVETKVGDHARAPRGPRHDARRAGAPGDARGDGRAGNAAAVLETTSHALALDRVLGVAYDAAIFTNLTHEHLDLHGSFEAYRAAKLRLFAALAAAPATRPRRSPASPGPSSRSSTATTRPPRGSRPRRARPARPS